jgi:myo-inositol-1(or 4)-monophosphatase
MIRAAVEAAQAAGDIIRAGRRPLERGAVDHKGAVDLVTEVDLACERRICEILARHTPEIPILAEEGGGAEQTTTRWIVDPLDGTTNFVHDFPSYAVSIGLQVDGKLMVAAIHDPVRNHTYTATRGGGAWCGDRPLRVSACTHLDQALVGSGFAYDRRERPDFYLKFVRAFLIRAQGFRRVGAAAMDLVHIAAGRLDGFWEFALNPWDVAAGVLLIQEAGGRVTDVAGGDLNLDQPRVLATNGTALHDEMLAVLAPLLDPDPPVPDRSKTHKAPFL